MMKALSIDQLTQNLGWYGKMPAAGDFMHRRMKSEIINWWHKWLGQGLLTGREAYASGVADAYVRAPIWNFALPANHGIDFMQFGCIAPSRDRVGRLYPLVATLYINPKHYNPQLLTGAARFYRHVGQALLQSVGHGCSASHFEQEILNARLSMAGMLTRQSTIISENQGTGDIFSILNEGHDDPPEEKLQEDHLSWYEVSAFFEPYGSNSFWWTNQVTGAAHRSVVHGGAPNATLFDTLFVRHQSR